MLLEATRSRIIKRIRDTTVEDGVVIEEATEIYESLGISGDDFYALVTWMASEFDVDFSAMSCSKLVPPEGPSALGLVRLFTGKNPYESCTVGRLLSAVERGRWE